jgi:hypothetical protein
MTNTLKYGFSSLGLAAATLFTSCDYNEDPGPLQEERKEFSVTDFDRLELGDAFIIDVEQGNYFEILVHGDRRNINDLEVKKEGTTLIIRYDETRSRKHDTYISITMPSLVSATFTGASDSRVSGFYDMENLDFYLAGASQCQLDVETKNLKIVLSGASTANIRGSGQVMKAEISGASELKAFYCPVGTADLYVSGASDGNVSVTDQLNVVASGSSVVVYRGNPVITSQLSGSSSVHPE